MQEPQWHPLPDCDELPEWANHAHCVHGHFRDCPTPLDCDRIWPPDPPGNPV